MCLRRSERAHEGNEETEENKMCVHVCEEVPGCQPFSIMALSLDQKALSRCRCSAVCVCIYIYLCMKMSPDLHRLALCVFNSYLTFYHQNGMNHIFTIST